MSALATDISARELTNQLKKQIPILMDRENVPGLALAIIRNAEIFWNYEFGVQSNVSQETITDDTVFEAASLSKPVFAYAVLKLCEAGVLSLDTPLTEYLPEPYVPDEPRMNLLTARHILSHTSGFPNWRPKGQPLELYFSPGERFSYSGEGFMYLQEVVAHITGLEPAEFMWTKLLEPLGMEHSWFIWEGQDNFSAAVGHDEKGKAKEKNLWKEMYAAASLHSTPKDFGEFMCAVMKPSSGNPAYLSSSMLKEMLTPQIQVNDSFPWQDDWPKPSIKTNELVSWGLGWGIQHTSFGDSIWHWGDNGNYRAFVVGYPEKGEGIVIMTNGKNGQKVIQQILCKLIGGDYPGIEWLNS